jgi:hypothetical protein
VDRHDPENRDFVHPDPIGWTADNRGPILAALYTILLGNPIEANRAAETRFKGWHRLVGSAVEHASAQYLERAASGAMGERAVKVAGVATVPVRFRDLFLAQEAEEEESVDLGAALVALTQMVWPVKKELPPAGLPPPPDYNWTPEYRVWKKQHGKAWEKWKKTVKNEPQIGGSFVAVDLAQQMNDGTMGGNGARVRVLREFLFPVAPKGVQIAAEVSAGAVGKRLSNYLGNPVRSGDQTLVLRAAAATTGPLKGTLIYQVDEI